MAVGLNQKLLSYITGANVNAAKANYYTAPVQMGPKAAAVSAVKTPRAPQVLDTVQTKYANGDPLLAGYVTPEKCWVA